jgi:hypothetical protein
MFWSLKEQVPLEAGQQNSRTTEQRGWEAGRRGSKKPGTGCYLSGIDKSTVFHGVKVLGSGGSSMCGVR